MLCKSGGVFVRGISGPDKTCSPRCQRNAKATRDERNAHVERTLSTLICELDDIAKLLVVWRPFFSHAWHAARQLQHCPKTTGTFIGRAFLVAGYAVRKNVALCDFALSIRQTTRVGMPRCACGGAPMKKRTGNGGECSSPGPTRYPEWLSQRCP